MPTIESVFRKNTATTDRIMKNAIGYVVTNNLYGVPVVSSYDNTTTSGMIKLIAGVMVTCARSMVRDLDSTNDLKYLRIATRKVEYLIAPETEFTIIVVANKRKN